VLAPQQRQDYLREVEAMLGRAERALGTIRTHRLSSEQQLAASRIESFIRQAQEARNRDLALARSLAERADVLSRDLLSSLR
jgi:hypothetical protein